MCTHSRSKSDSPKSSLSCLGDQPKYDYPWANVFVDHIYTFIRFISVPPDKPKGCKDAVLRIQNGEELQEFCGTFTDEQLSEKAFLSFGDYQYIR